MKHGGVICIVTNLWLPWDTRQKLYWKYWLQTKVLWMCFVCLLVFTNRGKETLPSSHLLPLQEKGIPNCLNSISVQLSPVCSDSGGLLSGGMHIEKKNKRRKLKAQTLHLIDPGQLPFCSVSCFCVAKSSQEQALSFFLSSYLYRDHHTRIEMK